MMDNKTLVRELRRIAVKDSLRCFGCGHEHNCSIHGCVIIKEAADVLEAQNFQLKQAEQTVK